MGKGANSNRLNSVATSPMERKRLGTPGHVTGFRHNVYSTKHLASNIFSFKVFSFKHLETGT